MNLLIWGSKGKMGQIMMEMARQDSFWSQVGGTDQGSSPEELRFQPQVVIDFSHPNALPAVLAYCTSHGLPLVIGTTGIDKEQSLLIDRAALQIPIMQATNMSVGMNLMFELVEQVAAKLKGIVDIEVLEAHHNRKKDAPSGSAVTIIESIEKGLGAPAKHQHGREGQCPRQPGEIGVHAIRGGNIVGLHEAHFINDLETVKIIHEAHDRSVFAQGALIAAKFILKQEKGRFTMKDVLAG